MKLAIIGVSINFFVAVIIYIAGLDADLDETAEIYALLFYPAIFLWLVSVAGLSLALLGVRKTGASLLMLGCILFIPVGLIGFFGGTQILKKVQSEALDVRRSPESRTAANDLQTGNCEAGRIKTYHARHRVVIIMLATLAVILLLLVIEFQTGISTPLGILVLFLIMQGINYHLPTVTLGEDYLKIGMGLTRKHNLLFSEIKGFEQDSKKITFYYQLADDSQSGKTSLYLMGMTPEVQDTLLRELLPKLASNSAHQRR